MKDTAHTFPTSQVGDAAVSIPLQSQTGDKETVDPTNPPPGVRVKTRQTRSGRIFKIIGEIVYELGSDGSTLKLGERVMDPACGTALPHIKSVSATVSHAPSCKGSSSSATGPGLPFLPLLRPRNTIPVGKTEADFR